jgi:tetratricopeptide (TPR) repeat protein
MQAPKRTPEGLAFTWAAVPDALRYGLLVGLVDAPLPPIEAILKREVPNFALLGIPARYTAAREQGPAGDDERQYGLIAYRADGSIVPVAAVRFYRAPDAPRDREYFTLAPPALSRPAQRPAGQTVAGARPVIPSAPPAAPASSPASRVPGARTIAEVVALFGRSRPLAPSPSDDPALVALLDEAELYLLPHRQDLVEAGRLLDRAAALVPADPRLQSLRQRLRDAQDAGAARRAEALLQDARHWSQGGEHWQAAALYEQVLAQQPDHAEARDALARARLQGRWTALMAGASEEKLRRVGDEFAASAPDLAAQSYAAAFAIRPASATLHRWLLALVHGGQRQLVVETARRGVQALRADGQLADDPDHEQALARLQQTFDAGPTPAAAEEALRAFRRTLGRFFPPGEEETGSAERALARPPALEVAAGQARGGPGDVREDQ